MGAQHPCQPTVKLHILPLVWIFLWERGSMGTQGAAAGIFLETFTHHVYSIRRSMHPHFHVYSIRRSMHPHFNISSRAYSVIPYFSIPSICFFVGYPILDNKLYLLSNSGLFSHNSVICHDPTAHHQPCGLKTLYFFFIFWD